MAFSAYSCHVFIFTCDDLNLIPIIVTVIICNENSMIVLQMYPQMKEIYTRRDTCVTCQEHKYAVIISIHHEWI
jgi:hypothetical protein